MRYVAITNNPGVEARWGTRLEVEFFPEDAPEALLLRARDRIHLGWRLVSHPLAGSIKPNQTPYRSLLMEEPDVPDQTDAASLLALEDSLAIMARFAPFVVPQVRGDEILSDLRLVDLELFESAAHTLNR